MTIVKSNRSGASKIFLVLLLAYILCVYSYFYFSMRDFLPIQYLSYASKRNILTIILKFCLFSLQYPLRVIVSSIKYLLFILNLISFDTKYEADFLSGNVYVVVSISPIHDRILLPLNVKRHTINLAFFKIRKCYIKKQPILPVQINITVAYKSYGDMKNFDNTNQMLRDH